jgi:alkylation response protein AidB-like acyl-CoA dehydrogenase
MHGGIGLTWDHDLHLYLRRLTTDRVVGGAPRDHVRRLGCWAIEREKHD